MNLIASRQLVIIACFPNKRFSLQLTIVDIHALISYTMLSKLFLKLFTLALVAGCLVACNSTDKTANQSRTDTSTSATKPDTVINTETVMEHPNPPPVAK